MKCWNVFPAAALTFADPPPPIPVLGGRHIGRSSLGCSWQPNFLGNRNSPRNLLIQLLAGFKASVQRAVKVVAVGIWNLDLKPRSGDPAVEAFFPGALTAQSRSLDAAGRGLTRTHYLEVRAN